MFWFFSQGVTGGIKHCTNISECPNSDLMMSGRSSKKQLKMVRPYTVPKEFFQWCPGAETIDFWQPLVVQMTRLIAPKPFHYVQYTNKDWDGIICTYLDRFSCNSYQQAGHHLGQAICLVGNLVTILTIHCLLHWYHLQDRLYLLAKATPPAVSASKNNMSSSAWQYSPLFWNSLAIRTVGNICIRMSTSSWRRWLRHIWSKAIRSAQ